MSDSVNGSEWSVKSVNCESFASYINYSVSRFRKLIWRRKMKDAEKIINFTALVIKCPNKNKNMGKWRAQNHYAVVCVWRRNMRKRIIKIFTEATRYFAVRQFRRWHQWKGRSIGIWNNGKKWEGKQAEDEERKWKLQNWCGRLQKISSISIFFQITMS